MGEQLFEGGQGQLEPAPGRHLKHPQLLRPPAHPNAQEQPATAEVLEPERIGRQPAALIEGREQHAHPQQHCPGHPRKGGQQRQAGGQVAVARPVVLAHPRRFEAGGLGQVHQFDRLREFTSGCPPSARRHLTGEWPDADPDAQRRAVSSPTPRLCSRGLGDQRSS